MSSTKLRNTDPRVLNDIDNVSDEAKAFHDMKAGQEAKAIADKYGSTPGYLRLLSAHLEGISKQKYSKHMQKLDESRPENQERALLKKQIKREVLAELGMSEDDYNG